MLKNRPEAPLAFVAIQAAIKAGHLLKKGFGTPFNVSSKASPLDLVTEFDKAAEKVIIGYIQEQFPTHSFLAEESGATSGPNAEVNWIIDPLDGTMNFAHNIPLFAVSIAVQVNKLVEVGVIYQPMTEELFVAQRGYGAYLNGTRIHVSESRTVEEAVLGTGFPYGDESMRKQGIKQFNTLVDIGNPIRLIGSAALGLAYVAAGRFDGFWGMNLQPWDLAAGMLLIEEAGGMISHFDGSFFDLVGQPNIVVTNKFLHTPLLAILK